MRDILANEILPAGLLKPGIGPRSKCLIVPFIYFNKCVLYILYHYGPDPTLQEAWAPRDFAPYPHFLHTFLGVFTKVLIFLYL